MFIINVEGKAIEKTAPRTEEEEDTRDCTVSELLPSETERVTCDLGGKDTESRQWRLCTVGKVRRDRKYKVLGAE